MKDNCEEVSVMYRSLIDSNLNVRYLSVIDVKISREEAKVYEIIELEKNLISGEGRVFPGRHFCTIIS